MTTPSPYRVSYELEAEVLGGTEWMPLNVSSMRVSVDADRINFTEATLELADVTDEQWEALEPREQDTNNTPPVRFRIAQYDENGDLVSDLPPYPRVVLVLGQYARLWMRTVTRDYITGNVTVQLASGESMMSDKLSIATVDVDTGATTVAGLVSYCRLNVFSGGLVSTDILALTTNIPAGDRRLRLIGNDMLETCRNELDAINYRLSDYYGFRWWVEDRSKTPPETWKLATYTQDEGAPSDADPIVLTMRQEVTRDGDFADGVLAEFNWTNSAGTRTVDYHITGGGANTKGFHKTYNRPKPAANTAAQLLTRTEIRGDSMTITARNRFDLLPYDALEIHHRIGVWSGIIRSVAWDTESGEMTITAQTGIPV